ncbi:ferrous iron transporter A [Bacillus sp. SA1-12]|uniref:FusB/FusC family EF-G-binding protein n=1 Tax=Bacillus sp. SA1-12 TaxID=1455638 RepID=UPI000626BC06|nr:elongation factor G-binding protein [Bacillus sp. SA1-12]KKI94127.1 ferrous iron transporter A [Bacillus sp. SA1-12]
MEPFIKSYQFHFIKKQTQILLNGQVSTKDPNVLYALQLLAIEKVFELFPDIDKEQEQILNFIQSIKEREQAETFLLELKPYVIPFKDINDKFLKNLFPKVKKLKLPNLEIIDFREISYLGWTDQASERKYLVFVKENKFVGIKGAFKNSNKKGICSLCNSLGQIGMFITESKPSVKGTYINKGRYICQDSMECNQKIINEEKLIEFIEHMNH